jgi:ArsR family transcriptional regulator
MVREYCCEISCIDEAKVSSIKDRLIAGEELSRLAETFRVLGDPTRVRILHALSLEELCVCDIACLLGTTKSAVSHQLRLLRNLRVVRHRKAGKIVYYSLNDGHVQNLLQEGIDHLATENKGCRR